MSAKEFKVKAVPAEGYHLVSLSDGTNTYDVDADGIATVTMPAENADLTLTATFSDEYELTFDDKTFGTNANINVAVGDGTTQTAATLTDGKLSVKAGHTVTLTAASGYKFRSVEAKKAGAAAEPVTYTELKDGDVLHLGDIICLAGPKPIRANNSNDFAVGKEYTLIRATITGEETDPVVTPAADGAYYVFSYVEDEETLYQFEYRSFPITATSDGISVKFNGEGKSYNIYTFSVHEPTGN